jgi:F420-dependent oxidoreductase-like protein
MAIAGRSTSKIELGTAVLQTYPCHPLLQANRVGAAANAMARPGLTLGIGPSHEPVVHGVLGMSYEHAAANTDEYLAILTGLLRGQAVDVAGEHWTLRGAGRMVPLEYPVPVLLAALGPRMVHIAGRHADGVVLWMAAAKAIETRIAPQLLEAAAASGRPTPRIVAGLPVAVHDDIAEARAAVAATSAEYANMANYQRIIDAGGGSSAAELAIVGDEDAVCAGLRGLLTAGATEVWAQPVAVGAGRDARRASLRRTRDLLCALSNE